MIEVLNKLLSEAPPLSIGHEAFAPRAGTIMYVALEILIISTRRPAIIGWPLI
jgi:hypothetical protein